MQATVDGRGISWAVANLVANTIRHTPPDGSVVLEARAEPTAAVITVTDECGGIDAEHLTRVFETGWRATEARTPTTGEGAGLGLAIVRGVAEAHDGSVGVQNVGDGCRFEIRIPVET